MIILLCGLSGAGKTTLATHVKHRLAASDIRIEIIDADEYRRELFQDLGYSKTDRLENIRRLGYVANRFSQQGIVTLISAINPYEAARRELIAAYSGVKVVHIDCPVKELIKRDTKGLYHRALLPDNHPQKVTNLSGVNDPFQIPASPDLYINTYVSGLAESTARLASFIQHNQYNADRHLQIAGNY